MAITLGGVSLPDVVVENEFAKAGVRAVTELTLGGRPIVWEDERHGKSIDLVGGTDTAWIDRTTIEDLQALADVPQSTYTLNYEGDTKTVRFRNEDPPVLAATPVVPRPNQAGADWYNNVRIKLMDLS